jgi:hypothetical protein
MKPINRGRCFRRTKYQPSNIPGWINRERIFSEAWEDENEPRRYLNFGHGILQDLFFERVPHWPFTPVATHRITRRERMVTATAIQWLGSNCGWCWLEKTLRKCGYMLVECEPNNRSSVPPAAAGGG